MDNIIIVFRLFVIRIRHRKGDPLGLLLFLLVLNTFVMKIAEDSACSHVWYLDDGALAGPRSSSCRILTLLKEEGPALGTIINLLKCEVFSRHGLDMFPLSMKKSNKPNMEILGISIGNQDFCSSFISKKQLRLRSFFHLLRRLALLIYRLL